MLFLQLVASNPELANDLPDETAVFVMPKGDDKLCRHNQRLAQMHDGPALLVTIEVEDSFANVRQFESKGSGRYELAG